MKAVYHTMNLFNVDVTQKALIGECWCPVTELENIQQALRRGTVCILKPSSSTGYLLAFGCVFRR